MRDTDFLTVSEQFHFVLMNEMLNYSDFSKFYLMYTVMCRIDDTLQCRI